MRWCLLLLLLCGCAMRKSGYIATGMSEAIKSPYSRSVVQIGGGSGVVVAWNGVYGVLTAWHVVSHSREMMMEVNGSGHRQMVGPFRRVELTDVAWAVAKIPKEWVALPVGGGFDGCIALGFPNDKELVSVNCSDGGWISGKPFNRSNPDGKFRLLYGFAIQGMSGGPIINKEGKVVGVVSHTGFPDTLEHYAAEIPNGTSRGSR